jgi:hypothetical protein
MRPRRFRPAVVGLIAASLALLPLAGCTCHRFAESEDVVKTVNVWVLAGVSHWRAKYPERVVLSMKLGERVCWRPAWNVCKLDVAWKPRTLNPPFAIQCDNESGECFAASAPDKKGTFAYQITATCFNDVSVHIDPDVVVMD